MWILKAKLIGEAAFVRKVGYKTGAARGSLKACTNFWFSVLCLGESELGSWMHCLSRGCMCLKISTGQTQRCQLVMDRNPWFSKPPEWGWMKRVLCPTQAMALERNECCTTWLWIIWGSHSAQPAGKLGEIGLLVRMDNFHCKLQIIWD